MTAQLALGVEPPAFGDEHDFWATPAVAIEAITPILGKAVRERNRRFHVLEPAAGEGALLNLAWSTEPASICTCEIDPKRHAQLTSNWEWCTTPVLGDFFRLNIEQTWPGIVRDGDHPLLVLMNPPWTKPRKTIGREFVERCLDLARPSKGIVCALLQLDWAAGVAWTKVHRRDAASLYPLRTRPKFDGEGTGKRPAAWFVWDLANPRREWAVIG